MPIRIRLVRESGDPVRSVTDKDGLVDRATAELPSARLLRYVDPYGDTYFNKLQMADLLADWQDTHPLIETASDEECWSGVEAIIRECQSRTHLYVRFVGD